jgi:arylsulfatase
MPKEPGKDRTAIPRGFDHFRQKLAKEGKLKPTDRKKKSGNQPQHFWSTDPAKPNVLWIMADQLRADTFGFIGHPSIKTPNLDRLAREGAYFTRSYCTSPVCAPSRASFLTGQYLWEHDVINNPSKMNEDSPIITKAFEKAGYRTAHLGKHHAGCGVNATYEYHHGVEDVFGATKPSKVAFNPDIYPGVKFVGDEVCDNSDRVLYGRYPGPEVTTKSYIMATEANKFFYWHDDPRPFFYNVYFDDPHPPVVPPEPYASMYSPEDVPDDLIADMRESMANKPQVIKEFQQFTLEDKIKEEDHRLHAMYYMALVTHLDAQIGRILDYLDELGIADNTIVIVNSDHGHMIGEHGLCHKGTMTFEGVARIPTIIRWPARVKPGTRIDAIIDGTDLVATLYDIIGVDQPESVSGRSFLPLLEAKVDKTRDHAFIQWDDYGYCIVGERWKLTWWDPYDEGELYDLKEDPLEKQNRFDDPECAEIKNELLQKLNAWRQEHAAPPQKVEA